MTIPSLFCPICGAKISAAPSGNSFTCAFCAFERKPAAHDPVKSRTSLESFFKDVHHLIRINPISKIYIDSMLPINLDELMVKFPIRFHNLSKHDTKISCIWSDITLPFEEDLAAFFQEKFKQLEHGGLLYLSLPVKRPFQNTSPLSGQINFFQPKNIMFLLEQHGFKMAWRKNRFSTTLRIIARKN